ncbi:MAG TPA: histidine phosphatase family protein [Acidimicrobiales bacterium]|nr:histidine phosphatase family protein [Acidimicrobiales bacterium]
MLVDWARHGQNTANLTRTLSHKTFDGDLTDLGRQQAHDLGRLLATRPAGPPTLLVCSPLRRARQTAEIVGGHLGLRVARELDDLRELDVGSLDGRSDETAWATYNEVLGAWRAGNPEVRFPEGENCHELCARLRRALVTVAICSEGAGALVVAHGASLRASVAQLMGVPEPTHDLPTGTMAKLEVTAGVDNAVGVKLLAWGRAEPHDRTTLPEASERCEPPEGATYVAPSQP